MKVFVRNKMFSLGGSSVVLNENQESIFVVKGKLFSPTKKKRMYDMKGNLLYVIRNRFWNGNSRMVFVDDATGDRVASIKKKKRSLNSDYEILDTDDEMSIDGKFFSLTSQIKRNGQDVASITRDFAIAKDAFILEAEEKDIPLFTALVIAFDNLLDKTRKEKD